MPEKNQNVRSDDDHDDGNEEGTSPAPAATAERIDNTTGGYSRDPGRGTGGSSKQRRSTSKREAGRTGSPATKVDNTTGAPSRGGHESVPGGS